MSRNATVYHLSVELADIDRGVYTSLHLRLARHPSESMRYLVTRALAYCLNYEDGIAFSKKGVCSTEPPVFVCDADGQIRLWIEIGSPSAARLHKALKVADRVIVYAYKSNPHLQRRVSTLVLANDRIIELYSLEPTFLDLVAAKLANTTAVEFVRHQNLITVAVAGASVATELRCVS